MAPGCHHYPIAVHLHQAGSLDFHFLQSHPCKEENKAQKNNFHNLSSSAKKSSKIIRRMVSGPLDSIPMGSDSKHLEGSKLKVFNFDSGTQRTAAIFSQATFQVFDLKALAASLPSQKLGSCFPAHGFHMAGRNGCIYLPLISPTARCDYPLH